MMKKYHVATLAGGRDYNQDNYSIFLTPSGISIYIVADGLGGHKGGEIASELCVNAIKEWFMNNDIFTKENMERAIFYANKKILEKQNEDFELSKMRTTICMVATKGQKTLCAHVGDSRIYVFDRGEISYISEDDSVPMTLYKMGEIAKHEIKTHAKRSSLLRSLGISEDSLRVTIREFGEELSKSQKYLLASDGFWEYLTDTEILLEVEYNENALSNNKSIELLFRDDGINSSKIIQIPIDTQFIKHKDLIFNRIEEKTKNLLNKVLKRVKDNFDNITVILAEKE